MAQPDILGRTATVGEPFSSDDIDLGFVGDASAESLVVQQLGITYQQNITRLWEIGSDKQYFVAGHQEGGMTMARVIGPKPIVSEFTRVYGDVCRIQSNIINMSIAGACNTNAGSIQASGCVITQVAYSVNAQDMVVNEQVNLLVARVTQL